MILKLSYISVIKKFFFIKLLFYFIFYFRERGSKRERRRETSIWERNIDWLLLTHVPDQGPGLQPSHVLWLGIKLVTFSLQKDAQPIEPHQSGCFFFFSFILRLYLFIFRERGREAEREGEKHLCVVASHEPPTGDLACNLGICPDSE